MHEAADPVAEVAEGLDRVVLAHAEGLDDERHVLGEAALPEAEHQQGQAHHALREEGDGDQEREEQLDVLVQGLEDRDVPHLSGKEAGREGE